MGNGNTVMISSSEDLRCNLRNYEIRKKRTGSLNIWGWWKVRLERIQDETGES